MCIQIVGKLEWVSWNLCHLHLSVLAAIKIGRYTLNRKTENILKVKSLEAMDSVIEKAILSTVFPDYSLSIFDSPASGKLFCFNFIVCPFLKKKVGVL